MAKAVKLGATVIIDFMPVPPHGALGIFEDPTGAVCAVWEPAAQSATKKVAKKAAAKKPASKKATAKPAAKKPAAKKPAAKKTVKRKTR
jgi:hypothetical protein